MTKFTVTHASGPPDVFQDVELLRHVFDINHASGILTVYRGVPRFDQHGLGLQRPDAVAAVYNRGEWQSIAVEQTL